MLLPLLFPMMPMIGARAMSRDHLARFTATVAEHCYGKTESKHDPYARQRVQYYQWKMMKKYERNLGYRVLATAYDCLMYYIQYWQLMYVLRAIHTTFSYRSYSDY